VSSCYLQSIYTYIRYTILYMNTNSCIHSMDKKSSPHRGRILGRNPDKSLKSFPPCYKQSTLQLCLEICISSNSRNLLQFLQFVTVKEKGGKPDRKPYPLPYGLRNPSRNFKSENSQGYSGNLNETVPSRLGILLYFSVLPIS
jgi:hypothetical protein